MNSRWVRYPNVIVQRQAYFRCHFHVAFDAQISFFLTKVSKIGVGEMEVGEQVLIVLNKKSSTHQN